MNPAIFLLFLLNFAYIGLLPRIFFKKGKFHLLWWITGAPFLVCTVVLAACFTGYFSVWTVLPQWIAECFAVPLSALSMSLISCTIGTHRSRPALWHQNEPPESIVTYGAYRYIRHPFYTSFLLALLGALLFAPHPGTVFTFLYGLFILNFTASKEEKFLSESNFGDQYRDYLKRSGRFLPWFM